MLCLNNQPSQLFVFSSGHAVEDKILSYHLHLIKTPFLLNTSPAPTIYMTNHHQQSIQLKSSIAKKAEVIFN